MRQKRICLSKDTKTGRKRTWLVRWWGEYDPAVDKQRRYSKSFLRKIDAENFMHQKMQEFDNGLPRDEVNLTLEKLWGKFEKTQKGKLKAGTFMHYEEANKRMGNYFGPTTCIRHIRPEHVEQFLSQLNYTSPRYKNVVKKLSDSTWNRVLRSCRRIFNKALEWQYIRSNPFDGIKQLKARTQPWHKMDSDEFNALINKTSDIRQTAFYAVLYGCGLRTGEAINLLWDGINIDFEKNRITLINRSGTETIPPFELKDHEARSVPMPNWVVNLLLQLQEQADSGCPFVFLDSSRWHLVKSKWQMYQEQGKERQWNNRDVHSNLLRQYQKNCKKAGIKTTDKHTLHCMRKSWACNLADNSVPVHTLMKLGGWSSIETCQQFYLQSTDANEKKAIEGLEKLVCVG